LVRHEGEYEKVLHVENRPYIDVYISQVTVHGLLLSVTIDMSYLAGRKLKLSIHRRRMQFLEHLMLCMLNWVAQAQKRLYCTRLAHFVCQF